MGRRPRRKFTEEQKRQAVDDYLSGRKTAAEVAKENNVAQGQIYKWKIQFEEGAVKGRITALESEGHSPSQARRIQQLEAEVEAYKKKLAEEVLLVDLLKKLQTSTDYHQLKNANGYDEIAALLAQSKKRARR